MQYQSLICIVLLSHHFICYLYEMHERKAYWSGRLHLPVHTSEISKSVALRKVWVKLRMKVVRVYPFIASIKVASSIRLLVYTHGKHDKINTIILAKIVFKNDVIKCQAICLLRGAFKL
jgi:hypothetical protein